VTTAPPAVLSTRADDRALDDALDRMRQLVGTVLAVPDTHRPALRRRGLLRRPVRVCTSCGQHHPCTTRRLLHASHVAGT